MAMDIEIRDAFSSVGDRFDKVDERFDKVDDRFDKVDERLGTIDDQLTRAAGLINALAEGQGALRDGLLQLSEDVRRLTEAQGQTEAMVQRLGERLDGYAKEVVRGFTDATDRDRKLDHRVDSLERRVTDLEDGAPESR